MSKWAEADSWGRGSVEEQSGSVAKKARSRGAKKKARLLKASQCLERGSFPRGEVTTLAKC